VLEDVVANHLPCGKLLVLDADVNASESLLTGGIVAASTVKWGVQESCERGIAIENQSRVAETR